MSGDSYLAVIGGIVIVSGFVSYFLDERGQSKINVSNFSVEKLIRFLGIVCLVALFCVAFGLASWLVSLVYWFVIESVGKVV